MRADCIPQCERRSNHESEKTAYQKETYRTEEAAGEKRSTGSSATLDLANHCGLNLRDRRTH